MCARMWVSELPPIKRRSTSPNVREGVGHAILDDGGDGIVARRIRAGDATEVRLVHAGAMPLWQRQRWSRACSQAQR